MTKNRLDLITREEFDQRLDACNARRQLELQQTETELTRVEPLLAHYEQTLDKIEAKSSKPESPSQSTVLRKRLQELANKTAEVAASL